jgi:hypothetical protein
MKGVNDFKFQHHLKDGDLYQKKKKTENKSGDSLTMSHRLLYYYIN